MKQRKKLVHNLPFFVKITSLSLRKRNNNDVSKWLYVVCVGTNEGVKEKLRSGQGKGHTW